MFVLSDLQHTVKIFPEEMNIKMEDRIIDKLNAMLANKVIKDVGLCLTFYDFIKIDPSYIPQGSPTVYVPVQFRYLVFVLFPGEVIDCFIRKATRDGLYLGVGFYDSIFVPAANLPEGSAFDENEQQWNWNFKNEDQILSYGMETNTETRVLIENITYKDGKVGKNSSVMSVTGTINTPGLGCLSWWQDVEEEQEAKE
uniref:RNA polymerase III subunit Rpc25 domain-containing protein n=1 Tax=Panagrolaimus superbus TaxID=310955 RepID=A0A914YLJ0_9BILA